MSRLLLAATPAQGHVAPMLAVARHLVGHGHEVVVLTSPHFAEQAAATGARFEALRPEADRHDLLVASAGRGASARRGFRGLKDDLTRIFIDPAPHQYHDLVAVLSCFPADAVLVDAAFVGVVPLALLRAPRRTPALSTGPAVAMLGVLPLTLSSRDTAPFGLGIVPWDTPLGRMRNRVLNWAVEHVALRGVQRHAQDVLAAEGCPPLDSFVLDAPVHLADAFLQATTEAFEYPRRDLPVAVRFVGPILPTSGDFTAPHWWGALDRGRPVVHVTQGTLDNADLTRLVLPTIEALAGDDVLVVATTGGPDPASVAGPLPANARLERFVPHDRLLPKVDVMVTNGGYGGVQQALARGVPLVVAGDSEDKPEVAARVAWSGTGVNLRTGRPGPDRIAAAVHRVLGDPSFGARARSMQRAMLAHDPMAELDAVLAGLVAGERA